MCERARSEARGPLEAVVVVIRPMGKQHARMVGLALLMLSSCAGSTVLNPKSPERLEFALADLAGRPVSSDALLGRVVLVDFWATWCRPCEQSLPFYTSLYGRLEQEGFSVVAVNVDAREQDLARFLERHPLPFTVVRDPEGRIARQLDSAMETMPTAVLVGRDGRIRRVHGGFVAGDEEKLEREVRTLLAEPTPVSMPSSAESAL